MARRFLRQFYWLDWSILAKRRKSQFEEKNFGQITVSFGRTQLYVCKTKPTFATNEQTLGGTYWKSLSSCTWDFFHKFPSNSEFARSFLLVLLCLKEKVNFCYNWTNSTLESGINIPLRLLIFYFFPEATAHSPYIE
mgnify:CR=1 FL=1